MEGQKIIIKYRRLEIEETIHIMIFNLSSLYYNQLNVDHLFLSYLVLSESHIYHLMPQDMTVK